MFEVTVFNSKTNTTRTVISSRETEEDAINFSILYVEDDTPICQLPDKFTATARKMREA